VIPVAATIAAATGLGVWAERRWGKPAQVTARRLLVGALYTLSPFVTFFNVARLHVDAAVAAGLGLGIAMLILVGAAGWLVGARLLRLRRPQQGALIASVMQANTGYVGLPFVVILLGSSQLSVGAAYDALVTNPVLFLGIFAVGAAFGERAGESAPERLRAFVLRNPPLIAAVAALLAPAALAPDVLVDASRVAVFAFVPLGFFAVGVTLAQESEEGALPFPPPMTAPVASALVLRLLVAPAVLLGLAAPLVELPDAYLLMAAMPTGINTLVVAHVYGLDLRIAAGAIAWSTAIVVGAGLVASVAT
jgi:malate permease and related proteins